MGELVQSLVAQSGGSGALVSMILPIGIMVVVMWFFMIRPERKKQTEHQAFLASLKRGDEVVLTSGIIGKVYAVDERTLTLEIADKVRIRVLKLAVTGPSARFLAAADGDKAPKLEDRKDDKKPSDAESEKSASEKKAS